MPADISTSEDFVILRTTKTRAAQATLATDPGWTWPIKTLAQWDADIESLDATKAGSIANSAKKHEADMLRGRGLYDGRLDEIHKFTLLAVGIMRLRIHAPGATGMEGIIPVVNRLSSRGDSRTAITHEAELLKAAWEEWEEQKGEAFLPAPLKTLAAFKRLLEGDPESGQASYPMLATLRNVYNTLLAKWQQREGVYNALISRLEDECVSWYGEATKVFLEGTVEGDMIRNQVPTDYSPEPPKPAPGPVTPPAPGPTA